MRNANPKFIHIASWSKNLAGQRFGRLTVTGAVGRTKSGSIVWLCLCECGGSKNIRGADLSAKGRGTRSCGCIPRERMARIGHRHGGSKTPEFRVWSGIMTRCRNPNSKEYQRYYGSRGIDICEQWAKGEGTKTGFECFLEDVGHRPSPDHSIDRIDVNGGYEPGNCRWATRIEQQSNRRDTVLLEHDGRSQTAAAWERERGLRKGTIKDRLNRGWSLGDAINVALAPTNTPKAVARSDGQTFRTIGEAARSVGGADASIRRAINRRIEFRGFMWKALADRGMEAA